MTTDQLQTLLTVLLGGGLLTALVAWRRDRRQAPIERRTAVDASAKVQSEIRSADIEGLREIIAALREQTGSLREEVGSLQEQVTTLRAEVKTAEERSQAAEFRAEGAEIRAAQAESRATASELARQEDAAYITHLIDAWPTPPPPTRDAVRRTRLS